MITKIFSIYDSKAEAHLPPFFLPKDGQAIRAITDAANDKTHQFGLHPEDYTLYCHGIFDQDSGEFVLQDKKALANCLQLVIPATIEEPNTNPT